MPDELDQFDRIVGSGLSPTPTSARALPIQSLQLKNSDLEQDGLPTLNNYLTQVQDQINRLSGATGPTELPSGVDVRGATLTGLGQPQSPTDAVSLAHAEDNYSAAALSPKLEASGSSPLKTYRALNSKAQRENYSTFLENCMSTSPTANTSTISADPPVGGTVTVTVSAGSHLYVSGNELTYAQRTDTLSLPTSYSISSISRTGGVVTANFSSAPPFTIGDFISIAGVSNSSFDGSFQITGGGGTTFTWNQSGANASSSGGGASQGTVYYYFIGVNSRTLALAGPYSGDTQENRLNVNIDGTVLVAVIVLTGSGVDLSQSAGGATTPAETGNVRLLLRL